MSEPKLGFVGLGRMGGNMAPRLVAAGHDLVVFDTLDAAVEPLVPKGVVQARSPEAVGAAGISWIEAPVSGGIKGAREGTLAVMVCGPRAAYDQVEDILKTFGRLFYVGEKAGLAQVAKLVNNLLNVSALVITSEAMVMATKAGIAPEAMLDIINVSTGRNSATQDKFPRSVLPRTFDFGFATGLAYKDVRMCVDEAELMGVPMIAGAVVRQMLAVTQAKYNASSDFTSVVRVVEEWAGVEVKGTSEK